jgi:hypothetical protein
MGRTRPGGGGRTLRRAACALVLSLGCGAAAHGQVIDRILAVVGGEIITLSDASAALRLGLVQPRPDAPDPIAAALDPLIDRHLQLAEANRYLPPEPSDAAVAERMAEVRGRFATEEDFETVLRETGMSVPQLRGRLRDDLRIHSYREQRFGAALMPGEDDVRLYYRANEPAFTRDGVLQPYDEVRAEAKERLVAEHTDRLIVEWLQALRRRADLAILYRSSARR